MNTTDATTIETPGQISTAAPKTRVSTPSASTDFQRLRITDGVSMVVISLPPCRELVDLATGELCLDHCPLRGVEAISREVHRDDRVVFGVLGRPLGAIFVDLRLPLREVGTHVIDPSLNRGLGLRPVSACGFLGLGCGGRQLDMRFVDRCLE